MTCSITLPLWPTAIDCLAWSQDNQLAVLGGESTAILSPRLRQPRADGTYWDSTLLKINAFSALEVPRSLPTSLAFWSIGEELSLRNAQAGAWSSPGLGKHRGCVLAILTSDHTLSIWASDGKASSQTQWQRQLVINQALREYYRHRAPLSSGVQLDDSLLEDRVKAWQRVKSFAWSSPAVHPRAQDLESGYHLLAVATGGGQILLFHIESPHNQRCKQSGEWVASVVASLDVQATPSKIVPGNESDDTVTSNVSESLTERIADHVAWSQWQDHGFSGLSSNLAWISQGTLFTTTIFTSWQSHRPDIEVTIDASRRQLLGDRSDVCGPLRFMSTNDSTLLVTFGVDTVFEITTQMDWGSAAVRSHDLDDRWDSISGVTFTNSGQHKARLSLSSHLSTLTSPTSSLALPLASEDTTIQPGWRDAIEESLELFRRKHSLNGSIQERVWGIAASPLGDHIATCATFHPSDSLSYTTQADQECIVNITHDVDSGQEDQILPELVVSPGCGNDLISSAVFSIQRWQERDMHRALSNAAEIPKLISDALYSVISRSRTLSGAEKDPPTEPEIWHMPDIVGQLKRKLFYDRNAQELRVSHLAMLIAKKQHGSLLLNRQMINLIAHAILEVQAQPADCQDLLSQRLRQLHAIILEKLHPYDKKQSHPPTVDSFNEDCRACHQTLPFESFRWARCAKGHQFPRCAISFLAIQESQMMKTCSICNLQYLCEVDSRTDILDSPDGGPQMNLGAGSAVPGKDPTNNETGEYIARVGLTTSAKPVLQPSLGRALLMACDLCVHCGGKFTG